MIQPEKMITINTIVEITAKSLQTIVANMKTMTQRNSKGHYEIDPAEKVNELISRFLLEKDFEGFVKDIKNYN